VEARFQFLTDRFVFRSSLPRRRIDRDRIDAAPANRFAECWEHGRSSIVCCRKDGKDTRAAVEEKAMDDPSLEVWARKSCDYLPDTQEEAEELAALIELAIDQETGHGIRDLCVTINGDGIQLAGRCNWFYDKQMAQHAAMGVLRGQPLVNAIKVR
jgi:hypothetical protein